MTTQDYFKIGSRVKYLRHDTELKVCAEVGILRAIFLDPKNRLMAQVKNGENAHNVHYITLDFPPGLVKDYKDLLQDIRGTSNDGDKIVDDTVKRYNLMVEGLTSKLLGKPVELESVEVDEEDERDDG